jgi:hypothetical protein
MPEAPHGVVKDIAGVLLHAFASESEAEGAPTKSLEEMFAEANKAHGLKFPWASCAPRRHGGAG